MAASSGHVQGGVKTLLRVEGATVLAVAAVAYRQLDTSWWMFAALFFLPDLSFAFCLAGPRAGSVAYNAVHSYIAPALVAGMAYFGGWTYLYPIANIWAAHIGFDRAAGYGLKYSSAFEDTHLGPIGRRRPK